MKLFKISITSIFISIALIMSSCGQGTGQSQHGHDHDHDGDHENHQVSEINHGEGAAFSSHYVCPMHCAGSGSEEGGNCPVCGMVYVKLEDHIKDGHTH